MHSAGFGSFCSFLMVVYNDIAHVASFGDEIQVLSLMYICSEFKPFNKAP